jgi:hypothetical protein
MSQALNRPRGMERPPTYSPPMPRHPIGRPLSKPAAATRASRRFKRWDRLRASLDLIPDQRGADMVDLPNGASGMLVRDCKGKEADRLRSRQVANMFGLSRFPPRVAERYSR